MKATSLQEPPSGGFFIFRKQKEVQMKPRRNIPRVTGLLVAEFKSARKPTGVGLLDYNPDADPSYRRNRSFISATNSNKETEKRK